MIKIYSTSIESIYLGDNKISSTPVFPEKQLQHALTKSGLITLMKDIHVSSKSNGFDLSKLKLFAVAKVNGYVDIFYRSTRYGKLINLTAAEKNKVKKYISTQILDGWNENGLTVSHLNNKYIVFLKAI